MKETFHEFFRPSKDEFALLWQSALISFDANTLLNLYRYSPSSSDALVDLIKSYTDRIRLPHQFSKEYSRNRPKVIMEQVQKYIEAEKAIEAFERDWIQPNRTHPHLSLETKERIEGVRKELSEKKKIVEKLISDDRYADFLLTACAGKIGQAPDATSLEDLYSKAKERYEKLIPPGFEDQDKGIPGAYGDYIAWEQLISISMAEQKDVILVTDDTKDDWWWKERGRTIGPRAELLSEFKDRSGKRVWLYTSEGFLRAAKEFANADVPDDLLKEVVKQQEEIRRRQEAGNQKPVIEVNEGPSLGTSEKPNFPWETSKPDVQLESSKPRGESESQEI